MNNNVEQFTNILMIILVVLVSILFILAIVYFLAKKKEKEPLNSNVNKKEKNKNKKQDTTKTESGTVQTLNKQSILDFMEFDKVEDNMIIQKGGKRFIMVVECQGINYDLMSEMEKNGVEEGFIQFLNTLRHPIQIYVQTRTVNLADSIQRYKTSVNDIEMELNKKQMEYEQIKRMANSSQEDIDRAFFEYTKKKNLYEYGKDIIKDTEKMSLNKNVLTKKYYVIIPYFSEDAGKEEYTKDEIQNMAFSELYTKSQAVIRTLFACSVAGKILNSYELVELLYNSYNREQAEVFGIDRAIEAGYEELYSTAPDIITKKERVLDEKIREEAMIKARQEVDRVKSEREKAFEQKNNSMEELIQNMAKLILEENKEYIGTEIADEAIENIDEEIEETKLQKKEADEEYARKEKIKTRRGRRARAV